MTTSPETVTERPALGVTLRDRVAAAVAALLVLVGFAVTLLVLLWFSTRNYERPTPLPVEIVEEPIGSRDLADSQRQELVDPSLEQPPSSESLDASLTAVTDVVSSVPAFSEPAGQVGGGPAGGGEEGSDRVVPRHERWDIRYASSDPVQYAKQLDHFGIELGAVGGKPQVDYAAQLSQPQPATRSAPSDQETRLYMTWRSGDLQEADRALLAKAGIDTVGRIVMQFYPAATENGLAFAERAAAKGRPVEQIAKTVFAVRAVGDGFEFYVVDQQYRDAP